MKMFSHRICAMPEVLLRRVMCPALVAALVFGHAAQAQQALAALEPPETPETLGAVVVTTSRNDTRLEDMPLYTTVITQKDIQNSPAQSLDQLLCNVPSLGVQGTQAAITDPTGYNIKFRGLDKNVLVLLDGMPILDPFYTTIQWFKMPLSSIERIETSAHYTNGHDQSSNGLEFQGGWQASRAISLNNSFTRTLTYYTSVTTTDPLNMQLPLVPKNVLGVPVVWTPNEQWSNALDRRASAKQQLSSLGSPTVDPVMQGGYALLGAGTTYRINKNLGVFAPAVNLSNKRYSHTSANNIQSIVLAMPLGMTTGLRTWF